MLIEFIKYKADLFILPIVRTIIDIPERFGNWFTDPLRWSVLGELAVVLIVGWTLWFRLRRNDDDETDSTVSLNSAVG